MTLFCFIQIRAFMVSNKMTLLIDLTFKEGDNTCSMSGT